jgi:hypothetical protein
VPAKASGLTVTGNINVSIPLADVMPTRFGPVSVALIDITNPSLPKQVNVAQTLYDTTEGYNPNKFHFEFDGTTGKVATDGNKYKVCILDIANDSKCSASFIANSTTVGGNETFITLDDYKILPATALPTSSTTTGSCGVPGVGWIICPVVKLLGIITDESYNVIKSYLIIDPSIIESNGVAHNVWLAIQSLSNILFVITFLVIIFSQLTSVGITNYGVKKMLPRLIIAAILVNISFFLCQISVDISNIVGNSIDSIIEGAAQVSGVSLEPQINISGVANNVLGGVGVVVGGAALASWISFTTLVPLLITGFIAIIVLLFILVARQALIILLVVLSPLAFVAFLLPNTTKWFQTWRKAFISMLMFLT